MTVNGRKLSQLEILELAMKKPIEEQTESQRLRRAAKAAGMKLSDYRAWLYGKHYGSDAKFMKLIQKSR